MSTDAGERGSPTAEPIAGRAMSGAMWSIAQLLGTRTLGFVAVLVLARLLAPADFGVVAAIVVLLSFIELAGDAGMKATVVYEQERSTTTRVQTAFTIAVIASGALTVLGVAVAPLLAEFFGVPEHTSLFRLAALNILLVGLGNVQDGILLRDLAFRRRLAADAVRATVRAAVAITLALAGFGAASLVWGMLAGTAVWVVVLFRMTRLRPTLRIDRRAVRSMGSYAAKSAALASLAAITTRVDVIVIGRFLGERALGLYTIAFRVPELAIQAVAWQLSLVMFPALSRKRATDEAGLPAATVRLIRLQALYVLPVAAALAVLAVPLVGILFGPAWRDATEVLVPVTVLSAMQGVTFPLGDLLKATGRQGVLLALNVVSIPLLVLAMTAMTSRGLSAVAWARVATTALFVGALVIAAWRLAAVSPGGVLRALGPGCVAALGALAGAGGVRLIWDDVSLLALGAAGGAGAAGAAALVLMCAPSAVEELLRVVPALAALKRRLTAAPVAAGQGEGPP